MDPNSFFPVHNHPEHQLMMLLRGALEQNVTDHPYAMRGESNDVFLMPASLVSAVSIV